MRTITFIIVFFVSVLVAGCFNSSDHGSMASVIDTSDSSVTEADIALTEVGPDMEVPSEVECECARDCPDGAEPMCAGDVLLSYAPLCNEGKCEVVATSAKCGRGCEDGACNRGDIKTCGSDTDCGDPGYANVWCEGNTAVAAEYSGVCYEGTCQKNYHSKIECLYGCYMGTCLPLEEDVDEVECAQDCDCAYLGQSAVCDNSDYHVTKVPVCKSGQCILMHANSDLCGFGCDVDEGCLPEPVLKKCEGDVDCSSDQQLCSAGGYCVDAVLSEDLGDGNVCTSKFGNCENSVWGEICVDSSSSPTGGFCQECEPEDNNADGIHNGCSAERPECAWGLWGTTRSQYFCRAIE